MVLPVIMAAPSTASHPNLKFCCIARSAHPTWS
jgi:hypothetical protein